MAALETVHLEQYKEYENICYICLCSLRLLLTHDDENSLVRSFIQQTALQLERLFQ